MKSGSFTIYPKRVKVWTKSGGTGWFIPKKNNHGSKSMLCVWLDLQGVIHYELLPPGQTVTGKLYVGQLEHLGFAWAQKYLEYEKKSWDHHHVAKPVKDKLKSLGWEVVSHTPYSSDIAPFDYYLFRSMASAPSGEQFINVGATKDPNFFWKGIYELPKKWKKVIEAEGKYSIDY